MVPIFILLIGFVCVTECAFNAQVKVGDYAQVFNMVEKVFVDTSGTARNIWKGGVVVRDDTGDGKCHIAIKELRATYTEVVTYALDCGRLLPSDYACPSAASVPYKCQQTDTACSSDSLYYNGFVVIDGPINSFPGSTVATSFAEKKYSEMKSIAQTAGLDPHSLEFHYSDVSSRGPGRWEMQVTPEDLVNTSMHWLSRMWEHAEGNIILPTLTGAVNKARSASNVANPSHTPVINSDAPLFTAVFDGVLISTPGADTQHWHRDSGLHTMDLSHYTVYIATSDVTLEMGPTEFLPGTNRDFAFKFDDWANYFDYCATTERPLLSAGSILIWEYRTIHRGTRNINYSTNVEDIQQTVSDSGSEPTDDTNSGNNNHNRNRPMLYRTYHLEGSWEDINMGETSFYKLKEFL